HPANRRFIARGHALPFATRFTTSKGSIGQKMVTQILFGNWISGFVACCINQLVNGKWAVFLFIPLLRLLFRVVLVIFFFVRSTLPEVLRKHTRANAYCVRW